MSAQRPKITVVGAGNVGASCAAWMAETRVPKLFINGEPGAVMRGPACEVVRSWPNQAEVVVKGLHILQEDSPHEIGAAIADFVRGLRGDTQV